MNITEFAKERNVQPQTVSIYINRHKEEFAGHTKNIGKAVVLDDVAVQLLDKKYPLPKPVEVVEGVEYAEYNRVRDKLEKAQDAIAELQREYQENAIKAREAELELAAIQTFLDDKTAQLEEKNAELERERVRADEAAEELKKYERTIFGLYRKKK